MSEEAEFQRLAAGETALQPVPFHRADVFAYDPAASVERDGDWSRLTPWAG